MSRRTALSPFATLLLVALPAFGQQHRFGLADPIPRKPGTLRVSTYNVLNLFDQVDDPALTGEHDDIEMTTTDERARAIAGAIRRIDADVVAMQEVESLACLTAFRDTYLADAGYRYLASIDVGSYRGIECSVMSRVEITDTRVWSDLSLNGVPRPGVGWSPVRRNRPDGRNQPIMMQRSPLYVELTTDSGYVLSLFVLHHKAGRDYADRREAEAVRVLQLVKTVERRDPSRNIIVLGDFNAASWDKSFRAYLEAGMIDTLAHRSSRGPEAPLHKTHESDRTLDYILLNSAAHREFVVGSAFVYGGRLSPLPTYDWRNDPYPRGYASDHYPVVIDLVPTDRK